MNIRYFKIEASRLEGAKHDFARDWEHLNPVSRYHLNLAALHTVSRSVSHNRTALHPTGPDQSPPFPHLPVDRTYDAGIPVGCVQDRPRATNPLRSSTGATVTQL
jgi:hypothetical protein